MSSLLLTGISLASLSYLQFVPPDKTSLFIAVGFAVRFVGSVGGAVSGFTSLTLISVIAGSRRAFMLVRDIYYLTADIDS